MSQLTTLYNGQDIDLIVELGTTFAATQEVEATFWNVGVIRKTLKKTEIDVNKQIIAVPGTGNETKCRVRVFRSELGEWVDGYVHLTLTVTVADAAFPQGRADKFHGLIANFNKLP